MTRILIDHGSEEDALRLFLGEHGWQVGVISVEEKLYVMPLLSKTA